MVAQPPLFLDLPVKGGAVQPAIVAKWAANVSSTRAYNVYAVRSILLGLSLTTVLLDGQTPSSLEDGVVVSRAEQIGKVAADLMYRTEADSARLTKEYTTAGLSQIRRIVRDQVLETLNASERPDDVRDAVAALFGR